jgi:hypothetical protein
MRKKGREETHVERVKHAHYTVCLFYYAARASALPKPPLFAKEIGVIVIKIASMPIFYVF